MEKVNSKRNVLKTIGIIVMWLLAILIIISLFGFQVFAESYIEWGDGLPVSPLSTDDYPYQCVYYTSDVYYDLYICEEELFIPERVVWSIRLENNSGLTNIKKYRYDAGEDEWNYLGAYYSVLLESGTGAFDLVCDRFKQSNFDIYDEHTNQVIFESSISAIPSTPSFITPEEGADIYVSEEYPEGEIVPSFYIPDEYSGDYGIKHEYLPFYSDDFVLITFRFYDDCTIDTTYNITGLSYQKNIESVNLHKLTLFDTVTGIEYDEVTYHVNPFANCIIRQPSDFLYYKGNLPSIDFYMINPQNSQCLLQLIDTNTSGSETVIKEWIYTWKDNDTYARFVINNEIPWKVGTLANSYSHSVRVYDGIVSEGVMYAGKANVHIALDNKYVATNYTKYDRAEKDMVIQKYGYGELTLVINDTQSIILPSEDDYIEIAKETTNFIVGSNNIKIKEGTSIVYELDMEFGAIEGNIVPYDQSSGTGQIGNIGESMANAIESKLPVQGLHTAWSRLLNLRQDNYKNMRPTIGINLRSLFVASTQTISTSAKTSIQNSFSDIETQIINLESLESINFMGMSLIELIRLVLGSFMVIFTGMYFWHRLIPSKAIQ